MRLGIAGLVGTLGILLVAVLPAAGASAPVTGVVTNCSSLYSCQFNLSTSAGPGWANGTGAGYTTAGVLSFQLPGEARASSNLTYLTYIGSLTGTYTYWVEGSFLGTDVNSGHVVYGSTNTNYTITCHGHSGRGGGCTYTYTTDNGTLVMHLTRAEQTSTTLSCTPTTVRAGSKATCGLAVLNLWNSSHIPTGKVHFASSLGGKFSNAGTCTLSSTGTCSFTWRSGGNSCGPVNLVATYNGNSAFYKSSGETTLSVTGGC